MKSLQQNGETEYTSYLIGAGTKEGEISTSSALSDAVIDDACIRNVCFVFGEGLVSADQDYRCFHILQRQVGGIDKTQQEIIRSELVK